MTGPLSYFIALLMAGFVFGIISLIVGIVTRDMATIGLALSVLFAQGAVVALLAWWINRNIEDHSKQWLKDAVAAGESERGRDRLEAPQDYRPERAFRENPDEDRDSERVAVPRSLFYLSALLLVSSTLIIAYVWESPRLALIWVSAFITLYVIHRYFIGNRSSS